MAKFLFGNFQTRLTIAMLLAVIPPLLAAFIFPSLRAAGKFRENAKEDLGLSARSLSYHVSKWDEMASLALKNLSIQPDIMSMDPQRQKPVLERLIKVYNQMYLTITTNTEGMNIARSDDQELKDYPDRKWFIGAIQGNPITRETLISRTTGEPSLCLSSPIKKTLSSVLSESKIPLEEIQGVAVLCISLTELTKDVGAVRLGKTGYAFLVDDKGQAIAHPDPAFSAELKNLSDYPPVRNLLQGNQGFYRFSDAENIDWWSYIQPLDNGWSVVVQKQGSEVFADEQLFIKLAISITTIALFFVCVLAWYTAKHLIQPISDLTVAAITISGGKFDQRVKNINGKDELAILAKAFNNMAEQLENSFSTLAAKNEDLNRAKQKLAEYNQTLEKKVAQRTAELAASIKEAKKAKAAAEEANQAKSIFLANMSHELRTPLNAIIGYGEMLQEEAEDKELEEFIPDLHKIHSAGKHLLSLINDILDLSKIEAGRMELFLETFEVSNLIQEVLATIKPLVEKNVNNLIVNYSEDIGTMHADLTKVRQNLLNLLSNASKFTERGTITLNVTRQTKEDRDWISFQVTDTGIGIAPEPKKKLFQAFTQADASTTRKYGGTGLGLALTKKFCQMMGGDIWVESEVDKGSTFTFELPVQVVHYKPQHTERSSENNNLPLENQTTVLVIDDDPTIHDILKRFLSKQGFDVQSASSGQEGINLAKKIHPKAITLDVMMPGMDGWAVLAELKTDPQVADIPVIMMTIVDDKNLGYALGASDYLLKPIERQQLTAVLQKYQLDRSADVLMLVEDDCSTREMMRRQLEKEGWQVVEADNGRKALELIPKKLPGAIVLDLMMPEMDGFEFVHQLRQNSHWSTIPIIVVTAKELTEADRQQLNGYVQKIFQKGAYDRATFLEEIDRLLVEAIARSQSSEYPRPEGETIDA